MMQFSREGFWGRGIYFAAKASYSKNYSYTPNQTTVQERAASGRTDEKEMFLAKLLIGNKIDMNRDESSHMRNRCKSLTVPPDNPGTGLKYNTVSGHTAGSRVYIVYENGRAVSSTPHSRYSVIHVSQYQLRADSYRDCNINLLTVSRVSDTLLHR